MTRADFETAIGPLQKAIADYPDYAPARGMLGLRLAFASHMGWIACDEGLRAAREHALRAGHGRNEKQPARPVADQQCRGRQHPHVRDAVGREEPRQPDRPGAEGGPRQGAGLPRGAQPAREHRDDRHVAEENEASELPGLHGR